MIHDSQVTFEAFHLHKVVRNFMTVIEFGEDQVGDNIGKVNDSLTSIEAVSFSPDL